MDEVSGSVDYDLRGQLPANSQLIVELQDTSLEGGPSVLISRDGFEIGGSPPHSFRLKYNPRSVGEKNTYSLKASIETADGQPLFTSDGTHDVITRGNPSRVAIDLTPTDLAEGLIVNDEPAEDQTEPGENEPQLIETMPVDSRRDALTTIDDPPDEAGGSGGVALAIILIVAIGFIVVLIARHRATRPTDEADQDDFIDDDQDQPGH